MTFLRLSLVSLLFFFLLLSSSPLTEASSLLPLEPFTHLLPGYPSGGREEREEAREQVETSSLEGKQDEGRQETASWVDRPSILSQESGERAILPLDDPRRNGSGDLDAYPIPIVTVSSASLQSLEKASVGREGGPIEAHHPLSSSIPFPDGERSSTAAAAAADAIKQRAFYRRQRL